MYQDRFEEAGQYLRLQVHDENLLEVLIDKLGPVDVVLQEEMERPVPQLPMPLEWGFGPFLKIGTEPKTGEKWGEMH
jgi:DNA polymerase I-like protein with 3'-5' exonuclease and polymerase domains